MKRKAQEDVHPDGISTTPKKLRALMEEDDEEDEEEWEGGHDAPSSTPKATSTLRTPTKPPKTDQKTPRSTRTKQKADRSAKRKSATALLELDDDDDREGENGLGRALAQEILGEDDNNDNDDDDESLAEQDEAGAGRSSLGDLRGRLAELAASALQEGEEEEQTPSKRRRGRPKGSKNRRSPTPEGDLPPEERYFFQTRSGPPEVSHNTLASLKLLTHDEYFALMRDYKDPHEPEKAYLMRLHARSFPQWRFEWHEGFNLCLYGWGSKRQLVRKFAEWLYPKFAPPPKIIIVDGYTPKLSFRTILSMLVTTAMVEDTSIKVGAQPAETLDLLLSHLSIHPPSTPIIVLINSIDSSSLRRQSVQALFARVAAHPSIHLLVTADTPTFPLLWDSSLRDQFAFIFHDCTTYEPYVSELDVVDDVHEILGRKNRRMGGGEGVGFVLKSLTENSRKLYVLLLTEILSALAEGVPNRDEADVMNGEQHTGGKNMSSAGQGADGEIGVEYRSLYQKASENFICSSEMNFRTLLKEFYDHQMIVSNKDAAGTEILGVPLGQDEMESLLEELVVAGS